MNLTPSTALYLLPAMLLLMEAGRRLRLRRHDLIGSSTIESAVFGLFGLLLAFTFSGAVSRYDTHRLLITQEANDIGTAYLRLSLLSPQAQPELRQLFREYTNSRLHLYDTVGAEISPATLQLQNQIWQRSVAAATAKSASPDAAKLLLPPINDMIDVTGSRQNAFNMHPPGIVFALLFAFSCGCAFLAGYSTKGERLDWVYALALAATVTLTIYATLEIEFPRQGLLRMIHLDQRMIGLRNSMN